MTMSRELPSGFTIFWHLVVFALVEEVYFIYCYLFFITINYLQIIISLDFSIHIIFSTISSFILAFILSIIDLQHQLEWHVFMLIQLNMLVSILWKYYFS